MIPIDSTIIFIVFMIGAAFNLFTVFQITKLPEKDHRLKRYWTNIVLFLPVFGAVMYYLRKKDTVIEKDQFQNP